MVLSSRRGRTISRNDSKTFPLPDDFFPEVKLSDEQVLSYETQVEKIVRNALAEYERHEAKGAYPIYGGPWVSVGTEGSLTAIRQDSSAGISRSEFRVFGRIHGNYRNFMDFYYAETSQELFELNQYMFGYAVDAAVLKNIHTRDSGKPQEYLGLKWTCLQPSSFGRKRDNCFLEYMTYTKDELGRSVGVRVTLPVEIDECPDLWGSLRVKRLKTHNVSIVRPAGDATQLFVMSENDFAGLSVSAKSFRKFMRLYNDMALFVDSKHISKQGLMCKSNWVPNDSRKACTNCKLPFNAATRRRYHCRLCGDIFCHHCLIVRNLPRENTSATKSRIFQVAKTHFCKPCLSGVRGGSETSQTRASGLARASSDTHASSVGTLSTGKNYNLRKAASNISDHSSSRQEWWDGAASQWSESDWSETDSEDTSKASLNASGRSRLASSLSSSQSSWTTTRPDDTLEKEDMAFVATLDVIDDDVAVLDEKPRPSKSKLHKKLSMSSRYSISMRKSVCRQQQQPRPSDDAQEVTEVIDTTDMMPMSELRRQSRAGTSGVVLPARKYSKRRSGRESLLSSSGPCSSRRLSRDEPTNRFRSSRSISQCLAEQEELLRCMLSASRVRSNPGVGSMRRVANPAKVDLAATMPVQRPTVRLYEI